MKDFFKYLMASFLAFLLAGGVLTFFGLAAVAGMLMLSASGGAMAGQEITPRSVLHLRLGGVLEERRPENPLAMLLGEEVESVGLEQWLAALRMAREDERFCAVLVEGGALMNAQPGQLQELREALVECRRAGRKVIAYADNYTQGCYYVCSAADSVFINPGGRLAWQGMAAQPIFYTDLLKKVGVKMDVFRVGTFKAAVEPFTERAMSASNREQVSAYLDGIWHTLRGEVAESRRLSEDSLDAYASRNLSYVNAGELERLGMVDGLCYRDELRECLRQMAETGEDESLNLLDAGEVEVWSPEQLPSKCRISVYYAEGDITEVPTGVSGPAIVAEKMMTDLDNLRRDDEVRAVVLRINSGGGSAFASEQIWREVKRLVEAKPVVVSMSGMAASGAYYLASAAHRIVAHPTTLTGSIGIFGMYPDATELLTDKLGLHFDVVKTNPLADMGNVGRPLNDAERAALQGYVEEGYALFLQRVAEGRGISMNLMDDLAQGRVWTGRQALMNGLVDEHGGLELAVLHAAEMAEVEDYTVEHLPKAEPWYLNMWGEARKDYLENGLRAVVGTASFDALTLLRRLREWEPVQARIPFEPNLVN